MYIIFEKITDAYTLKVARFTEDADILFQKIEADLRQNEYKKYVLIKNSKRKIEWCGTRILLKNLLGKYHEIQYETNGKPYLNTNRYISISHSENYIGIIISNNKNIGIDIEIVSERILKTAHKFITSEELSTITEKDMIKEMYLHWCAKETLYKIKGGGGYDFKKDFSINPYVLKTQGELHSKIKKPNTECFKLLYQFTNQDDKELLLVWHG